MGLSAWGALVTWTRAVLVEAGTEAEQKGFRREFGVSDDRKREK